MAVAISVERDARHDPLVEPLRLLWLIDSLTMGGAESLAVTFARAAARRGIALTVCSRTSIDANPLERELRESGTDVVNLYARNLRDIDAFRRLLALVRERRIQVVHAHLAYAGIWGALASRITGVPLVASLHVRPSVGRGREAIRQRILVFSLNRWARRVVTVSSALRDEWSPRISASKLQVLHNGVEAVGIAPRARTRKRFRITTVAVLREGKGIEVLVDAARSVVREFADVEFVVVGDGPMREAWTARAAGLPFVWTGNRRDVGSLLRESDLFVLPTLYDSFPTVLLEAMSAGVPVIASDVGGVPEIVRDGETGLLVPPGDSAKLASAILQALRDEEWRLRAAHRAAARFEESFTVDRWVDRLLELYGEVSR